MDQKKRAQNKYTDDVALAEDGLSDLLQTETSDKPEVDRRTRTHADTHIRSHKHSHALAPLALINNRPMRFRALMIILVLCSRPKRATSRGRLTHTHSRRHATCSSR